MKGFPLNQNIKIHSHHITRSAEIRKNRRNFIDRTIERVARSCNQGDARPLRRQRVRRRAPEPLARAHDEGHLVLKAEVHRVLPQDLD